MTHAKLWRLWWHAQHDRPSFDFDKSGERATNIDGRGQATSYPRLRTQSETRQSTDRGDDGDDEYVVSLPDFHEQLGKTATMSPAEQLAQVVKDPKAMSILKENGLTAREYMIGVPALRMALLVAPGHAYLT